MPKELDEKVTKVHLHALGAEHTVTTQEQAAETGANVYSILKVLRVLRGGTSRGTDNEFVISVVSFR